MTKRLFHVKQRSGAKYGSRKVTVDGILFDSKREAHRYLVLKAMEESGEIAGLQLQRKYVLIPAQRGPSTFTKTGKERPGEVIEREVAYVADFVYEKGGETIVEDAKGVRTKDYVIKRKLMLWVRGIAIKEI